MERSGDRRSLLGGVEEGMRERRTETKGVGSGGDRSGRMLMGRIWLGTIVDASSTSQLPFMRNAVAHSRVVHNDGQMSLSAVAALGMADRSDDRLEPSRVSFDVAAPRGTRPFAGKHS